MIRIGTSGFSFPDWLGTVYPKSLPKTEMLFYYENHLGFNTVELNFTYYSLPGLKTIVSFVNKTAENFDFVVKAYRGTTHDPFDDRLGEAKPTLDKAKEDTGKFVSALKPLIDKNKLGAVLLQFPFFFYPREEAKEYILQCKEWMKDIPLVIEFRNRAWAKKETFDFLRANNLGYCAVDEPKLSRLMPFLNEVTSGIAYLRFHGRSPNWFNAPVEERYNYLYKKEELASFIPEIQKMSRSAKKMYVFFNNCHAGSAARNALMLKEMFELPITLEQKELVKGYA